MQLQVIFGIIPRICGKGEAAMKVKDMLLRKRLERTEEITVKPEIESVILIDRAVDLITPLCSQLTYEGFIDELYGIQNNLMELPPRIAPADGKGKKVKVELNSGDKLYSEIRDMNFSYVGELLSRRAKNLSREYDERHNAKTVSQIKQFTSKLKRLQEEQTSLRMHTDIASDIMVSAKDPDFLAGLEVEQNFVCGTDSDKSNEYIEDCICRKDNLLKVLRLICLQSITNGGLKPKVFEFYKKELLQTYGFEHMLTLDLLDQIGMFKQQDGRNLFPGVRKALKLIVDDEHLEEDISYTHSGYAPLSVRLVQQLSKPGGLERSLEEVSL